MMGESLNSPLCFRLGEACNHIAGLLFKIEAASQLGYTNPTCTSLPCTWNRGLKSVVENKSVVDLAFWRPVHGKTAKKSLETVSYDPRAPHHRQDTEERRKLLVDKVMNVIPDSGIGILKTPKDSTEILSLPEQVQQVLQSTRSLDKENIDINAISAEILQSMTLDRTLADRIEYETRRQRECDLWYKLRKGRITASVAYSYHKKIQCMNKQRNRTGPEYLTKLCLDRNTQFSSPATNWGIDHEDTALSEYESAMKIVHNNFNVQKCGLLIDTPFPMYAASPDGIGKCICCGKRLIEVKCPFKIKDNNPATSFAETDFLTTDNSGNVILRRNHKYYCQVQMQMFISNCFKLDFVVWTTKGILIREIIFDQDYWNEIIADLDIFYKQFIIPAMINRAVEP